MLKWKESAMPVFIKLYKKHVCLWTRQKDKRNRRKRTTAWCAIAKEMSKLNEHPVSVIDCKQKMKYLWQKFRREKLKVMREKGENGLSEWSLYRELTCLEKAVSSQLIQQKPSPVPTLRTRKIQRVQRYAKPVTNGALNKNSETNIPATSINETKETVDSPKNSFSTKRKTRVSEDIGQTLRNTKIVKLNTTDSGQDNPTTPAEKIELIKRKKISKRPKYLNVNIIHNSTPEVHRSPVNPVSTTPLDSRHTFVQDECQCFGMYVANKTKTYSPNTRSAVQHTISDILFKADMGHYDRLTSSATVTTQTESLLSNVQQWPNTMQLSYVVKSEELSDLDDDSVTTLNLLDRDSVQ